MIHIERYGTGPHLHLALHGWGGTHATYAPLAPYVPASASMLAADLPGYGRSTPLSASRADEVAAAVLDATAAGGAERVTLLGNCSGAIFALLGAAGAEGRVARVVMIDPFAFVPWYFGIFLWGRFGRAAYHSTFANPIGRWITNASLRGRRAPVTHLTRTFAAVDHRVSLQYLEMLASVGSLERFRGLSVPVDIVYGARTFRAVRRSLSIWREVLPHARIWRIDGAGHLPIEEAPRQVASIVFDRRASSGRAA
jgi:pimeloyl-ACP methyl ester carboxylesterase